jgi:hypothetical protein
MDQAVDAATGPVVNGLIVLAVLLYALIAFVISGRQADRAGRIRWIYFGRHGRSGSSVVRSPGKHRPPIRPETGPDHQPDLARTPRGRARVPSR